MKMILYFDLSSEEIESVSSPDFDMAVHHLSHISTQGYHLVIIRREVARSIIRRLESDFSKAIFSRILNSYTQNAGLLTAGRMFVRICMDPERDDGSPGIAVGLDYVTEGFFSRPVKFFVENSGRDGAVYRLLITSMQRSQGIPAVNFDIMHGGGSSIEENFQLEVSKFSNAIAVIDSDRESPYDSSNKKMNGMLNSIKISGGILNAVYETPCHELENIFSIDEISILPQWSSNKDTKYYVRIFEEWRSGACDLFQFIDLKLGFDKKMYDDRGSKAAALWGTAKAKKYGMSRIDGFGDRIPMSVVSSGEAQASFHRTIRTKAWHRRFGIFSNTIFDWVIADRRFRGA